jgi:uncharacterized protein (DUF2249 family)
VSAAFRSGSSDPATAEGPSVHPSDAPSGAARETECLPGLNRLLIRAVRALGDAGREESACRIAAEAWALLRRTHPREAERLNGALHYLTRPKPPPSKENPVSENAERLDVRRLPPPQRHALIFEACGKLLVGNAVILVNDHDPKPLYYQFEAERPGQFGWEYVESGPTTWQVRITRKKAA